MFRQHRAVPGAPAVRAEKRFRLAMERTGIEPVTSGLQSSRGYSPLLAAALGAAYSCDFGGGLDSLA
jgi:hypothetical protein